MENNKQEDLDMISLIGAINRGINSVLKRIVGLFNFTLRHFFVFLIFIVVFSGLFWGLYYIKKPVYKSSMVLSHIRIENDYCHQIIKNLSNFIDGEGNSKLAAELSLGHDYAKEVVSIEYFPLNENISRRYLDSVTVLLPFKIEVQTFDPYILDTIQNKLVNYLENNEYAQKLKKLDEEAMLKTQDRLLKEISSIDSLKKIVEQSIVPRSQGSGIILGEPVDPVGIYKQSASLFEKKIGIEKGLKFNNTFEVRVGFPKRAKRSGAGPIIYLLAGIVVGYTAAFIMLIRRKIKSTY